ncbi:MAG: N-formylglutamate amidohydrolase [Cyanophyceae cyanobacterium]
MPQLWTLTQGDQPVIAVALHDGHDVRPEVEKLFALSRDERKREEDPFTARWTDIADTRLVVLRSRFELDLNRPRHKTVYLQPEDAWGLKVWREPPPADILERTLAEYDAFYSTVKELCQSFEQRYGHFVIYDLHTYNHYRDGQHASPAAPSHNPEVNLGTDYIDRDYWSPVVERFLDDMRRFQFLGEQLDVRENVKFYGGYFAQWVSQHFPRSACVLSVEVKKFFMNEWTHQPDLIKLESVHQALRATVPGVIEELQRLSKAA